MMKLQIDFNMWTINVNTRVKQLKYNVAYNSK